MNCWTKLSEDYANQENYLDELYKVYPVTPNEMRDLSKDIVKDINKHFNEKNDKELIKSLLKLELFPIKDSYVAYFRRDKGAINRNPQTVARICGALYDLGLEEIFERSSEPKEMNRQIGPLFKNWLKKETLGAPLMNYKQFIATDENAILMGSDDELKNFASKYLNYNREKGLDFVARFNGKYVIGEAKFLTDFGGHQNAQFEDAISTLHTDGVKAIKIAILDGVLYKKGRSKLNKYIHNSDEYIMSSLVLREFLHQL